MTRTAPAPGDDISKLEHELAERVGRSHCIATGSGTMALTMALEALGLPPGSEVIVPSVCCPSVPFAVAYAGLVPVFCDVSPDDYVLDTACVDAALSDRTRAVVGVHLFGSPAPVDDLVAYARSHSLAFIEDAAQAFGGRYRGENARRVRNDVDHQLRTREDPLGPKEAEQSSPTTPTRRVRFATVHGSPVAEMPPSRR